MPGAPPPADAPRPALTDPPRPFRATLDGYASAREDWITTGNLEALWEMESNVTARIPAAPVLAHAWVPPPAPPVPVLSRPWFHSRVFRALVLAVWLGWTLSLVMGWVH